MNCVIVANGKIKTFQVYKKIFKKANIIIAVDGGTNHLFKMNVVPNVIIGDLDSIEPDIKEYYRKKKVEFVTYPPKKDFTDTELAIDYALKLKPNFITLIGFLGSRFDHSLANIFLLKKIANSKIKAKIVNKKNEIFCIEGEDSLEIEGGKGDFLSIIPLTEKTEGIDLEGLEYPLINSTLNFSSTKGISNVFKRKEATIKIKKGLLLVIKSKD